MQRNLLDQPFYYLTFSKVSQLNRRWQLLSTLRLEIKRPSTFHFFLTFRLLETGYIFIKSDLKTLFVLTFEKEVRVILEGVVRLLHSNEAGVHCLPLLAVPGLCNQLGSKLEDQAEDAVDDVHDRSRFLRQQTPGGRRERGECKV